MSLKRALKALNLERPGDLLLLGVPRLMRASMNSREALGL